MRFSLRWLFVAILFIAVSVVALLNANEWWAGAARSALFFALPSAAVIAIASTGATRMFWLGFAIVGAVQFWSLGFARGSADSYLTWESSINWLHPKIVRQVTVHGPATGYGAMSGQIVAQVVTLPHMDYFRIVAHCATSAILGLLGGCIALWFYSRRDPRPVRSDRVSDNVTSSPPA